MTDRPTMPAVALEALWARHNAEWREPAQIVSQWRDAQAVDPSLLEARVVGRWWETLAELDVTALVTREYEHLVLALAADRDRPRTSYLAMPHPSGLVVDAVRGVVHVASTRNPNQVYDLAPIVGALPRRDVEPGDLEGHPLVPIRSRFYPGCLYLHDLALLGGQLHANAVGMNAVVRLDRDGRWRPVWWPRCVDTDAGPIHDLNHLQLNSIAAGADLAGSYFSASTDRVSARRPGHRNFPVDRRGVVFSGATREPIVGGLTRPHSARLAGGELWVDNSGYGELGRVAGGRFEPVLRLPGWTRGLCIIGDRALVGTSRVIPRFRQYAPGLDVERSVCAVHAVDLRRGEVLGSIQWPNGNQIFAIDIMPRRLSIGFPFVPGARRDGDRLKRLFYSFTVAH